MSLADHMTEIEVAWRSGCTLQEIGDFYGCTRERVRQLLRKFKVPQEVGGIHKRAIMRAEKAATQLARKRERRCRARYGLSYAEFKAAPSGLLKAFYAQKRSAKNRGIPFLFDFGTWLRLWQESGKLDMRGRGSGQYCMSRIGDMGAYELGNVLIATVNANASEARATRNARQTNTCAVSRGVYLLYPGTHKSYAARYGKHHLGNFATAEEAIRMRERVVALLRAKGKPKKKPARLHVAGSRKRASISASPAAVSESAVGGE